MNKVLVIGSNSFSGQDFIDLLMEEVGCEIVGVSRMPEKSALFCRYRRREYQGFHFHQLDLNNDMDEIITVLERERPDVIINFAAQSEVGPSWENPWHWYQTNIVALSRLTQFLTGRDWLQKYIHISSPEVYGACRGVITEHSPINPSTPYAVSKAAADLHLATLEKNFEFPLAWVRATNVYGPGQQLFKIIPRSFIRLRLGETIELHGGGVAVKSYIHIRDVSRGELAIALKSDSTGGYHLSPDEGIAVRELVRMICEAGGHDFEHSTVNVSERLGQDAAYVIDSTRARDELGWSPDISLNEGLAEVRDWVEDGWSEIGGEKLEYVHKP